MKKYINFLKEYGLLLIIALFFVMWIIWMLVGAFINPKQVKSTNGTQQVHWHMPISYNLCWDTSQLKDSGEHGKLHGHDDKQVHVEWFVNMDKRDETLWAFFKSANIPFSQTQIGKYKNGDTCSWSDTPWRVSVMINWQENTEFENYILNDKDTIKIIFK